jgi:ABC-type dipeptide/oligopeptide/nickel transport system permease subunit
MLSQARLYLQRTWWITTFPGLAIVMAVMAINLIGDALRDALDPRLRGVGKR